MSKRKIPFWCRLGSHRWYYGAFARPVYGRYERHCLRCPKLQYADYNGNKRIWVDFENDPKTHLGPKSKNPIEKGN